MPTVQRQQARPQARPQPPPNGSDVWGSVSSIRMLLYGQSGTGKTTFWATFPGPILCLLCSGSDRPGELRSIDTPEYRRKITPKVVGTVDDFYRHLSDAVDFGGEKPTTYDDLGKYPVRFGTIVLDHASGFADVVLGEIIGRRVPEQKGWGIATQQQYGQMSATCKDAFRKLLNLSCHVVIVAQERVFGGKEDGGDPEVIRPVVGAAMTPSLTGWLNPACDFVVQTYKRPKMIERMRSVGGKEIKTTERDRGVEYCLRTEPHETFMTKFRMPKGRPLPECVVDPDYDKIVTLIRGS